jgi:hypothetical protein
MQADLKSRIAADPELAKDFAEFAAKRRKNKIGRISDEGLLNIFARERNLYTERNDGYGNQSWQRVNTQGEVRALQAAALIEYEHQQIEARGLAEEQTTKALLAIEAQHAAAAESRRLAEEHRRIEEEGLANEAAGKELTRIMEEQARARSAAIIASFSAPNRAGVALDGSIAAYKAQFNNDNNYRRWMQENAKKAVDLQAQIAANTAGLQNAVPAVIGADIGA